MNFSVQVSCTNILQPYNGYILACFLFCIPCRMSFNAFLFQFFNIIFFIFTCVCFRCTCFKSSPFAASGFLSVHGAHWLPAFSPPCFFFFFPIKVCIFNQTKVLRSFVLHFSQLSLHICPIYGAYMPHIWRIYGSCMGNIYGKSMARIWPIDFP